MQTDLQAIRDLVTDAPLPPKVQQTVLARWDQLPNLYADLVRTYESRFADRIVESVERMVRMLSAPEAGPDAPQLAATIVNRMRAMHDRHGIAVILKPPPAVKPPRRKVSR
jgi:hypothetical protein